MTKPSWFEVDRDGLRQLLADRGPEFPILELLQNAWDEPDVTHVEVSVQPMPGRPATAVVSVTDDAPSGFADLTHAWTLHAPSAKKDNPQQRGRFNQGDKLVLALADEAQIITTTGSVYFDTTGRRRGRRRRDVGSQVRIIMRLTRDDQQRMVDACQRLLPPAHITTTVNSQLLKPRAPLANGSWRATLPTVQADDAGYLRRTRRRTTVTLYEPRAGETPTLYELGIPVVDIGVRWHVNVCVAPEARILTADLRYVPASEVKRGMTLVGFDEQRVGHRRRFRSSEVKHVERIQRPSYRLTFDDGTVVVCSEDHQWLTAWSKTRRWLTTKQMVPTIGNKPGSNVVRLLDVWEVDDSFAGGYLAAAFDGEGCLIQQQVGASWPTPVEGVRNRLDFTQNENAMLDRVLGHLRDAGFNPVVRRQERDNEKWATTCHVSLRSRSELLRFLGTYRPARLLPKLNLDLLGTIPAGRFARLIKKEYLGLTEVVAIETTTHTYVAEGLASHNCQKVPLNSDRDNVPPAFLRELLVQIANHTAELLDPSTAAAPWVRQALADPRVGDTTVRQVMDQLYGRKRVAYDPSDPEANKIATSHGYTVVHGGAHSRDEWQQIRRAGVLPPAGQVTPSPKVLTSPDGKPPIPPDRWTPGMCRLATYTQRLGLELLGFEPTVEFQDLGNNHQAWWGNRTITVNLRRVGHDWPDVASQEAVDALLLHEFAHDRVADHLDRAFPDEVARLGAKLRWSTQTLLDEPGAGRLRGKDYGGAHADPDARRLDPAAHPKPQRDPRAW